MTGHLLNQTMYRWAPGNRFFDSGGGSGYWPVAGSLVDPAEYRRWHVVAEPWLRTAPEGAPAPNLFYVHTGDEALLMRRTQQPNDANATTHLLFGAATVLTPRLALELRGWTWSEDVPSGNTPPVTLPVLNPAVLVSHRSSLSTRARSGELTPNLIRLLSLVLRGPATIDLPTGPNAAPLLWALDDVLTVFGSGLPDTATWTLAFTTFEDREPPPGLPGLFVRFRPGIAEPDAATGTLAAATRLANAYGRDGTDGLRTLRRESGAGELRLMTERVERLVELSGPTALPPATPPVRDFRELLRSWREEQAPPVPAPSVPASPVPPPPAPERPVPEQAANARPANARPAPAPRPPRRTPLPTPPDPGGPPPVSTPAPRRLGPADGRTVPCPICLGRIPWENPRPYVFDKGLGQYAELEIPDDATPEQRTRLMRTAAVRCPNSGDGTDIHYLPAAYGKNGPPAIFGFVGGTRSGKTHLAAAMVGAIEAGGLSVHGLFAEPLDLERHQDYMRDMVRPLLSEGTWLEGTREGSVEFADAFVISGAGKPRGVALYDVAGSELIDVADAKHFLDIADGLIFVADPDRLADGTLGDPAFSTVLNLLRASGRLDRIHTATVLNKADLARFDEPVARWLSRDPGPLDPAAVLEESADVFGYLCQRGAEAWTRPYKECARATLHFASATGTSDLTRGVRPKRVLEPLVALLAMTGVLPTPHDERLGI